MSKKYINNLETGHIELHFDKVDYMALTADQKKEIKSGYVFSRYANVWVSRSTKNHYRAISIAEKFGFTEEEKQGRRLSFEEELNRKAEKAERRIETYENYSDNAEKKAEGLQSEFNKMRKDWSFITQPNINSAGGRSFTRYREKIMNRYDKGFEEYRKSEYFKEKAITAQATANKDQLKNKTYLNNRIEECKSNIRKLEGRIVAIEDRNYKNQLEGKTEIDMTDVLEKMEYEIDKLAYLQNCMDDLGGVQYSKENIKKGYFVKIRGRWEEVLKANKKTVQTKSSVCSLELKYPYAEIREVKIPEGWTEEKKETVKNPFEIGNILKSTNIYGNRIIAAYQVVKTSAKTITIQEINVDENKPIKDAFIKDKKVRKTVKKDRSGNFVVNDGDWYLYRYIAEEQQKAI